MGGRETTPNKSQVDSPGLAVPHVWGQSPERASLGSGAGSQAARLVLAGDSHVIGNKPGTLVNSNLIAHPSWPKPGMSPGGGEGAIGPRCEKERARGTI